MRDSDPTRPRDEQEPKKWVDKTWVQLIVVTGVIILFVLVAGLLLDWYVNPETSKAKRDLVQALALITAGVAGAFGIYFTWRGQRITREGLQLTRANLESTQKDTAEQLRLTQQELHLTQQGQITERFTRAIEQLGAADDNGYPKLEIRLGGIYALERLARDSPERDYSTVLEVLTAYVRENAPIVRGPSNESSNAVSTANGASTEADEGANQPAPPPEPRRPTADIQAILDVISRAQTRVPEEHRIHPNLHEVDLQGAELSKANLLETFLDDANLRGATLYAANLYGTRLQEANLQGADLHEANLERANLQGADLQGADLYGANLQDARLMKANLQGANLIKANLQGADLQDANLQGAKVRSEQLATTWMQDTTQPDGTKL